ncbi:FMN-binding negative transcriptional regulator [Streptomyces zagrosensis]|uniref:Transcriptional regulator n=1 Tax=Streptomyces zagrosensis TaxID=1042984 RepID=A0A7W9QGD1_9ACTN|nr:FMN-binding negative transcriptional regulator [Streptomyces zagrosensis]MBB5938527.1 transcriptional regulator [Streptomyces zagrosensis]
MLIHPWDAAQDDTEWQSWLAGHDFGHLAVNGPPGTPPLVQPTHFAYDGERQEVLVHLARPNPIWPAIEAHPEVLLSVADDYVFVPGPWMAADGTPPEHGVPTSFYAAVQLSCTAHLVDDPHAKAALLTRQLAHFQPEGGSAPVAAAQEPYGSALSGIRGVRLEVTGVRAKFKYGNHKSEWTRQRTADALTSRGAPRDAQARAHQVRRGAWEPTTS